MAGADAQCPGWEPLVQQEPKHRADWAQTSGYQGKSGHHGDLRHLIPRAVRVVVLFLKSCWPTVGACLEGVGGPWLPLGEKLQSFPQVDPGLGITCSLFRVTRQLGFSQPSSPTSHEMNITVIFRPAEATL
jgi:hypothetical protein